MIYLREKVKKQENLAKPKIFMVGVGGTLSAKLKNGTWVPGELTTEHVLKLVPDIKNFVEIESTNFLRIDSTNVQPENWVTLANMIYPKLSSADGIVVTHGTDTMHYTATAISFLIQGLNKPIIFTGSQSIPSNIGSDAKRNLIDAVRVASLADIAESVIVFNGTILRGNRSKKFREIDYDAFECVGMPPLGKVEGVIRLSGQQTKRKKRKPRLATKIETNVALVKVFPGLEPNYVENLLDVGVKGLVLEGYGSGNVPTLKRSLIPIIEKATSTGIPVVITTQCALGASWVYLYEVGQKALQAGAIPAHDMLSETALVKLMWVLGRTNNLVKVKEMMLKNYAGEITPGLKSPKDKTIWETR